MGKHQTNPVEEHPKNKQKTPNKTLIRTLQKYYAHSGWVAQLVERHSDTPRLGDQSPGRAHTGTGQ